MNQYRKKPIIIEAVAWQGKYTDGTEWPDWFRDAADTGRIIGTTDGSIDVSTLEGPLRGAIGDMIIQGVKGELYPCKPDIFAATYDPILAEPSRPVEAGPLQEIYRIATRVLAEPGDETGVLTTICTLIEESTPGRPAEPGRECVVPYSYALWQVEVSEITRNNYRCLNQWAALQVQSQIGGMVQFSNDGGKTWQDADTSAAEGTK